MAVGIKVTELNNIGTTTANDLMYVVDDDNTISKKVELRNLLYDNMVGFSKLSSNAVRDDDTMGNATSTTLATSESIKAYVDNKFIDSGFGTYDGGESVTLPNGLTMKFGTCTLEASRSVAVTFGAFFSDIKQVQLTYKDDVPSGNFTLAELYYTNLSDGGFTVHGNEVGRTVSWMAIGR